MINVFKKGGVYKTAEGKKYDCKVINGREIPKGWFASLDELFPHIPVVTDSSLDNKTLEKETDVKK